MWDFGKPDVAKLLIKRDVRKLVRALEYRKDESVRKAAAEALGAVGDPAVVGSLVRAVEDSSAAVRRSSVQALGKLGGAEPVEALISILQSGKTLTTRIAAAEVLGVLGDVRAVGPLVDCLEGDGREMVEIVAKALRGMGTPAIDTIHDYVSEGLSTYAVRALGVIGNQQAIERLVDCLADERGLIRSAAVAELQKSAWQPSPDAIGAYFCIQAGRWDECVKIGVPAIELLVDCLSHKGGRVHDHAARTLGGIGEPSAVGPLIHYLTKGGGYGQHAVAEALGEIGDQRAVIPLIQCLMDSEGGMRGPAVQALGRLRNPDAVEPLLNSLPDDDNIFTGHVFEALAEIGDPRAVEAIIDFLQAESSLVRHAAAKTLGRFGDARAVEPLLSCLADDNGRLDSTVAEALGRIGDERAVRPIVRLLESGKFFGPSEATEALGKLGTAQAAEFLIRALGMENTSSIWNLPREAAKVLGRVGGQGAVPPLVAVIGEPNGLGVAAAEALGGIADQETLESLSSVLKEQLARECEFRQRAEVSEKLVALGDASAVPYYLESYFHNLNDLHLLHRAHIRPLVNITQEQLSLIERLSFFESHSERADLRSRYEVVIRTDAAEGALTRLAQIEGEVSTNLLHLATKMKDGTAKYSPDHAREVEGMTIHRSRLRRRAGELIRLRSFEGYNPMCFVK